MVFIRAIPQVRRRLTQSLLIIHADGVARSSRPVRRIAGARMRRMQLLTRHSPQGRHQPYNRAADVIWTHKLNLGSVGRPCRWIWQAWAAFRFGSVPPFQPYFAEARDDDWQPEASLGEQEISGCTSRRAPSGPAEPRASVDKALLVTALCKQRSNMICKRSEYTSERFWREGLPRLPIGVHTFQPLFSS